MLQGEDEAPYEGTSDPKGDEIQRLSVIQSLPSLLATDTQSCMSRVVPKMQQCLATASTEFHIAASSTFKTILEEKLVSHNVFSETFLQSILNSLESRDPVICHAWLETLLVVIGLLPVEVIRSQILPLAISKGQLSQPIYSRITCSRLLGKICTRFDSALIQKEVLPTVHSLCQDVISEVRASICLQLRYVAEGLGAESVKPALLPSLVELASDEESNVRCASVQTIVYLLPHLQEDTIKTIIVPLIKKLCENAAKSDDNVICVIAQDFGKLALGLEKCLSAAEKSWFLKYFHNMAQMGIISVRKESKPYLPFINTNPAEDEKYVECRRYCAYNLPAMFIFVSGSPEDVDALLQTFSALASDHYYMVRRTVACGIHEIAKVLGSKNGRIKADLIKLLKDDTEEVLQGLVPHIGVTLDCLVESQTIGTDRMDSTLMEIGRALLKCETEIASTHNWRLTSQLHSQLEVLPRCFPSDFIYSYFVPMAFSRILHAGPIPVRLTAGTLFLFLLRFNTKPMQRVELRNRLYAGLADNPNCYVRMMFVRIMVEALEIFSSAYFKEHFFTTLLNLAEDPVANIRMKVVSLLPQLKSQLWLPTDKKLLTALEATVMHLLNHEKDRDVVAVLSSVVQRLNEIDVKYEGQTLATKLTKQDADDARKLEEEKRLASMSSGKSPSGGSTIKKAAWRRMSVDAMGKSMPQSSTKDGVPLPRTAGENLKTSSMPEIPVMLSDDEFFVDAGIRIPAEFSASQSTSKIPHLQKTIRTSMDYAEGLRQRNMVKKNLEDQQLGKVDGRKDKVFMVPHGRSRFGFGVNQERPVDEKMKRNSLILEKDKPKVVHPKCTTMDRTKRHSANYSLKPATEAKETKPNLKRHSLEMTDYTPTERLGRALRRYSTLDVNHNQGLSKIPLRYFVSRSRTAPATRASSPVHIGGSRLRFDPANRDDTQCSSSERRLTRFSSSDEDVDKLCRMFLHSQTTPTSRDGSPRARDSRLPIRLMMKEL